MRSLLGVFPFLFVFLGCAPVATCDQAPRSDCCINDRECLDYYGADIPYCNNPGRSTGTCSQCATDDQCLDPEAPTCTVNRLAVSGQQPKENAPVQEVEQVLIERPATSVHAGVHQAELKILRLEGELQAERLRGQLQALQMERDALKEELLRERQRATLEANELREERDGWRDRHDAVRAELDARRSSGWNWFPRLLGPTTSI